MTIPMINTTQIGLTKWTGAPRILLLELESGTRVYSLNVLVVEKTPTGSQLVSANSMEIK